jgi:hypothetical protein
VHGAADAIKLDPVRMKVLGDALAPAKISGKR